LGRYTINLIHNLQLIDDKNEYFIILRDKYFNSLKWSKNFHPVLLDCRHYSLCEQKNMPITLETIKPNFVHYLHFNIPVFSKQKFVVTIHDLLMHKNKGPKYTTLNRLSYYLKRAGYKYIFNKAVDKSYKIITPSSFVKKDLLDNYHYLKKDKIQVIHEGFSYSNGMSGNDNSDILKKNKITKPYFLYVGNAYPHKNLFKAIEAVNKYNSYSSNKVQFVIVSPRDFFTKKISKYLKEESLYNQVKLVGYVSDKNLGFLYKNSLALLFPSLSEGFGLPGLEAMADSTLVAASNIDIFREIYSNNALYFDPGSVDDIVKVLGEIISMPIQKRMKRIQLAKKYISRYSWKKMAQQTLKIYESCYSI